jgi:hypothetical protein
MAVALLAAAGVLCFRASGAGALPPFSDIGAGLTMLSAGSLDWGDYDSDGDLDLLQTGRDLAGTPRTLPPGWAHRGHGLVIGWRPETALPSVLAGFAVALLFSYALSWLSAGIGMAFSNPEASQGIVFILVFPLASAVLDLRVSQASVKT